MAVAQRVNRLEKELNELGDALARFRDRLGNAEKEMAEITRSIQRMTVDVDNRAALQEAQRDRLSVLEARVIATEQRQGTLADTLYALRDSTARLAQYVGAQDAVGPSVAWSEPTVTECCGDCECCGEED